MSSDRIKYVSECGVTYTSDGRVLGRGAFGEVHSATRDEDDLEVAIKTKAPDNEHSSMLSLLDLGGDDNLMQLVDIVARIDDPRQVRTIVVERLDCTLFQWTLNYQKQYGDARFSANAPDGVKQEITRQYYSGLAFIHSNGLVHCDIHECNVMIHKRSGRLKICDFGNSCYQVPDISGARDRFRLMDLRMSVVRIAAPLWLNRHYIHGKGKAKGEFHGEYAETVLDNVYNSYRVPRLIYKDRDWWESLHEDMKATFQSVNDFNMKNPASGGVPVPAIVAEILTISLLYAPYKDCVAQDISAKFNAIVPSNVREETQDFIRLS